jgi:pSer/pThr/pTyr-binding forkhead associated (FHA) protein
VSAPAGNVRSDTDASPTPRSGGEVKARINAERLGRPFMVLRDAAGEQHIIPLDMEASATMTIGRSADADVALGWDGEVSRLHAQLESAAGEWLIVDDGLSRNGTFVNGQRVVGRRRLADGDALRVGATVMLFRSPRATPTATRTASVGITVDQLSDSQRKVLTALCRPYADSAHLAAPASNQQISQELFLSLDAVKANLRAMYQLFGVARLPQNQKRAQLAERAIQWGLVSVDH